MEGKIQTKPLKLWSKDFILLTSSNRLLYLALQMMVLALPVYVVGTLHGTSFTAGIVISVFALAAVVARTYKCVPSSFSIYSETSPSLRGSIPIELKRSLLLFSDRIVRLREVGTASYSNGSDGVSIGYGQWCLSNVCGRNYIR